MTIDGTSGQIGSEKVAIPLSEAIATFTAAGGFTRAYETLRGHATRSDLATQVPSNPAVATAIHGERFT
jgi:hypothetical protein